jgi:hypothetical protein
MASVTVKSHVSLAGRDNKDGAAPSVFHAGQVIDSTDEETLKATPWAFEPVDPEVKKAWEAERKQKAAPAPSAEKAVGTKQ